MNINKILVPIFLIRVFLPSIETLTFDGNSNSETPEYKLYSHQANENLSQIQKESPSVQFPFPQIPQLCKDSPPKEGNYYGHIYCWMMIALVALLIISLIVNQLRQLIKLKDTVNNQRKKSEEFSLSDLENGKRFDQQNFIGKSPDK